MAAGRLEPAASSDDDDADDDDDDGAADPEDAEAARWDAMMATEATSRPGSPSSAGPNVGKSSTAQRAARRDSARSSATSRAPPATRSTRPSCGSHESSASSTRPASKRRGKVASAAAAAERYATLRALKAVGRADVAVLVLDATDGLTAQDAHVAGYVVEEGIGLVVAINKWDIVEDKTQRLRRVRRGAPPRGAVP